MYAIVKVNSWWVAGNSQQANSEISNRITQGAGDLRWLVVYTPASGRCQRGKGRYARRRQLRFVFVGASTIDKVRLILDEYHDAILVSTQPVSKARAGERIGPGLKSEQVSPTDVDRAKLTIGNIQQFENEIDSGRSRKVGYGLPYQEMLPFDFVSNRNFAQMAERGR